MPFQELLGKVGKISSVEFAGKTESFDNLVSAVAGKRIKVLGWQIQATGNSPTVQWMEGTTQHTGLMNCGANHDCTAPVHAIGWFTLPTNTGLDMDLGGVSVNADGVVTYVLVE